MHVSPTDSPGIPQEFSYIIPYTCLFTEAVSLPIKESMLCPMVPVSVLRFPPVNSLYLHPKPSFDWKVKLLPIKSIIWPQTSHASLRLQLCDTALRLNSSASVQKNTPELLHEIHPLWCVLSLCLLPGILTYEPVEHSIHLLRVKRLREMVIHAAFEGFLHILIKGIG